MFRGDLNGKEIQKRGDKWICKVDSLCSPVETQCCKANYPPIKVNLKKIKPGIWVPEESRRPEVCCMASGPT